LAPEFVRQIEAWIGLKFGVKKFSVKPAAGLFKLARDFLQACQGVGDLVVVIATANGAILGGLHPPMPAPDAEHAEYSDPTGRSCLFSLKNPAGDAPRRFGLVGERKPFSAGRGSGGNCCVQAGSHIGRNGCMWRFAMAARRFASATGTPTRRRRRLQILGRRRPANCPDWRLGDRVRRPVTWRPLGGDSRLPRAAPREFRPAGEIRAAAAGRAEVAK
jgi:hypothetical protein